MNQDGVVKLIVENNKTLEVQWLNSGVTFMVIKNIKNGTDEGRLFLTGMQAVFLHQIGEALGTFRKVSRKNDGDLNKVARWAVGQCYYAQGKNMVALQIWNALARQDDCPIAVQYMTWQSIMALEEKRGNHNAAARAYQELQAVQKIYEQSV